MPFVFVAPKALAASLVTPAKHSSGVRLKVFDASVIASLIEQSGDVPGLQSVATAIETPELRSS